MRQRVRVLAALGLGLAGLIFIVPGSSARDRAASSARERAAPAPRTPLTAGSESGFAVFQTQCTGCHGNPAAAGRAPSPAALRQMPPERIYAALTTGSMSVQARSLTDRQKRRVAEFMSGRPLGSALEGGVEVMAGRCLGNPPLPDPASRPEWNGWGADPGNSRFQPARAAGLGPGSAAQLRLRWAFGFPSGVSAFAQPSIVSGRVFVGSDIGFLYSLDARTGCSYWSFEAQGSIRTATSVARVKGHGVRRRYAVYFGDSKANVYALDARSGALLWRTKVDGRFTARITGAPSVSGGVVYVPVSSAEEYTASAPTYQCCTSRGSVVALDASTGRRIWKTYVIARKPRPVRRNRRGTQLWAPAGGSVWDSPTVDVRRDALYFGTGDAETAPASSHTDAVMAVDRTSGTVLWVHQATANDAWVGGCTGPRLPLACPRPLGPDRDIGNSPILRDLPGGRRVVVNGTKDARVFALDPDKHGAVVWQVQVARNPGRGSAWGVLFGGAADAQSVYYPLAGGRMVAVELATGRIRWSVQLAPASAGQSYGAAPTVIPGVVFVGGYDGRLLALSTRDGRVLWQFDTARRFTTVNGVPAKGGSFGSAGPTIAGGMLFVGSGYGVTTGTAGNVLLAFAPD